MHERKRKDLVEKILAKVKSEGNTIHSEKTLKFEAIHKTRAEFGKNKTIPPHYEKHVLKALSYYPELKEDKISFVVAKTIFSMESQFKIRTVFSKNRHYVIKINKNNHQSLLKLSDETIVSLLCHELAHVVDYKKKSAFGLLKFGVRYLIPSQRRKIEIETDIRAILHGSGWFLLNRYDELVRNIEGNLSRRMPDKFVHKYYDKNYIRKKEIQEILKKEKL